MSKCKFRTVKNQENMRNIRDVMEEISKNEQPSNLQYGRLSAIDIIHPPKAIRIVPPSQANNIAPPITRFRCQTERCPYYATKATI